VGIAKALLQIHTPIGQARRGEACISTAPSPQGIEISAWNDSSLFWTTASLLAGLKSGDTCRVLEIP